MAPRATVKARAAAQATSASRRNVAAASSVPAYRDPIAVATERADPSRGFGSISAAIGGESLSGGGGGQDYRESLYAGNFTAKQIANFSAVQLREYNYYHQPDDNPDSGSTGAVIIDYESDPQLEYTIPELGIDPITEAPGQPEPLAPVVPVKKRGTSSLTIEFDPMRQLERRERGRVGTMQRMDRPTEVLSPYGVAYLPATAGDATRRGAQPTKSDLSARSSPRAQNNVVARSSPVAGAQQRRDGPICKPRPDDNQPKGGKGAGQSRPFVPWCDRKH